MMAKLLRIGQMIMPVAMFIAGIWFPFAGHWGYKIAILLFALLLAILDADNSNKYYRASLFFVLGAIIGFSILWAIGGEL